MAVFGSQGCHGSHGGSGSPLLSSALGQTAEALMGYWDGTVTDPIFPTADPLKRLMRLEPFFRGEVLAHEANSRFAIRPGANGTFVLRTDSDLLSFFNAQSPFSATRRPHTVLLVTALYDAVISQEQRMKHHCSVPRPVDLSPQIQPVIETPGHSAFPSGHATEAFAFATLFAALRLVSAGTPGPALIDTLLAKLTPAGELAPVTDPVILLYRLAARIADNRTVAGVHYRAWRPSGPVHHAWLPRTLPWGRRAEHRPGVERRCQHLGR